MGRREKRRRREVEETSRRRDGKRRREKGKKGRDARMRGQIEANQQGNRKEQAKKR